MIDDQYAPLSDKILAAVKAITPDPVRFVVNTHWHGDHTGGNENMGKAGAILVAHENVQAPDEQRAVQRRVQQQDVPAVARGCAAGRDLRRGRRASSGTATRSASSTCRPRTPTATSIVQFVKADVVHMGDMLLQRQLSPSSTPRAAAGWTAWSRRPTACSRGDATRRAIIPGHGPLATKADLQAYRDTREDGPRPRSRKLKAEGKSKDAAVAAKPTAEFDAKWGKGFIKPDVFVGLVFDSIP